MENRCFCFTFSILDDPAQYGIRYLSAAVDTACRPVLHNADIRMPWDEAMGRFGSDKPDTRFGLEIQDVTEVFKGTEFKPFAAVLEAVTHRCCMAEKSNRYLAGGDTASICKGGELNEGHIKTAVEICTGHLYSAWSSADWRRLCDGRFQDGEPADGRA